MPKGVPKTQGEKLKDKFDTAYGDMKKSYKRGKKSKKKTEDCPCEECKKKKK